MNGCPTKGCQFNELHLERHCGYASPYMKRYTLYDGKWGYEMFEYRLGFPIPDEGKWYLRFAKEGYSDIEYASYPFNQKCPFCGEELKMPDISRFKKRFPPEEGCKPTLGMLNALRNRRNNVEVIEDE